ncbi:MAG: hypothetical protein OMM_14789, partial [Candidatus Magnetoglobus multicellularis str. Araruama]
LQMIDKNDGSKYASVQLEQMKHYYKQAVSALEANELDNAQTLISKIESDKAVVISQMKKAVYNKIYKLNTYMAQLDESDDLNQVTASIENAKNLAENVEIVSAFDTLNQTETRIARLLESVCYSAQEEINKARILIESLNKTTNDDAQNIIQRANEHLAAATEARTQNLCKDSISEARQAKNIAESAVSVLINKDIRAAAKKRIETARKMTDNAQKLADELYETYGVKTPDQLQTIQNHYAIANNAFEIKQYDDAIKQA